MTKVHSMGAIGTYTILRDCPGVFAAAIIGAVILLVLIGAIVFIIKRFKRA